MWTFLIYDNHLPRYQLERIVVLFGLLSFCSLETVTAVQYCSPTLKELCGPGWSQTRGLPSSKSCILGIGICHQGPDPFVYRTLLWSINWFRGKCASFLILWTLTYAHFSFFSYQIVILSFQKDLYLKLLASLSEVSLNVWNVCILIQGCKDQTLPLIQVT